MAAKKMTNKQVAPSVDLEEHNRLLALLGLPAVTAPLEEGEPAPQAHPAPPNSALAIFDDMYAGEGPTAPRGRFIHWWGQFSDALPSPFTLPDGGHGYIEARDVEHATRLFATLRNAVLAMRPKPSRPGDENYDEEVEETAKELALESTREWAGINAQGNVWYRWMLINSKQMTVELKLRFTKSDLDGEELLRPD